MSCITAWSRPTLAYREQAVHDTLMLDGSSSGTIYTFYQADLPTYNALVYWPIGQFIRNHSLIQ